MKRLLLITLCALVPLANLKVSDIQPVEFFLLVSAPTGLAIAFGRGWRLRTARSLWLLEGQYLLFLVAVAILAALAWRFHFYVPAGVSWLKFPPIISFVRIVQVALAVTMMIVVANVVRRYEWAADFLARTYVAVGVISVLYGTASWLLLWHGGAAAAQPELNWFGAQTRWGTIGERGFFVEGGPFGVYVVSVIVVVMFRRFVLRCGTGKTFAAVLVLLLTGLALSRSKAAICVAVGLGVWSLFASGHLKASRRVYALTAAALLITLIATANNVVSGLMGYWSAYQGLERLAIVSPQSGSVVEGRVMALYVVPAMVAAHPLTGIGFGNYSVLRNSPDYAAEFPPAPDWDEPGLGFFGYSAELGLPMLVWLMVLAWAPVRLARSRGERDTLVLALCACQFFAELFGAPITFFYPWLVSALALGYVLRKDRVSIVHSR